MSSQLIDASRIGYAASLHTELATELLARPAFGERALTSLLMATCVLTLAVSSAPPIFFKSGLVASIALFLFPKTIVFDFRSDWQNMDYLRSLPLRPWVVSGAQLVTPAAMTTVIELAGIASAIPFAPAGTLPYLLLLCVYLPPVNVLLSAADNLVFLLFPAPLTPVGRLDFEFFGRALLEFSFRMGLVAIASLVALRLGLSVSIWLGGARAVLLVVSWSVLALTCVMLLPCLSWAYRRFEGAEQAG